MEGCAWEVAGVAEVTWQGEAASFSVAAGASFLRWEAGESCAGRVVMGDVSWEAAGEGSFWEEVKEGFFAVAGVQEG